MPETSSRTLRSAHEFRFGRTIQFRIRPGAKASELCLVGFGLKKVAKGKCFLEIGRALFALGRSEGLGFEAGVEDNRLVGQLVDAIHSG